MRGTYNDKNISANKFLSLTLTNTVYKTNPENVEFIAGRSVALVCYSECPKRK